MFFTYSNFERHFEKIEGAMSWTTRSFNYTATLTSIVLLIEAIY